MKKTISLLLCVLMLFSTFAVTASASDEYTMITLKKAIQDYEKSTGETLSTHRYYFLMPDGKNGEKSSVDGVLPEEYSSSWYNEHTDKAGIYWWDSNELNPSQWPGYEMSLNDHYGVFYADVPDSVKIIVFNNCVNGGMDPDAPIYYMSKQSIDIDLSGYEKNISETYPDGMSDFHDMIYVIDPSKSNSPELSTKQTHMGEWYYYYGIGCYGTVKNGTQHDCIRDDHDHENMFINFDLNSTGWTDVEKVYCTLQRGGSAYYYLYMSLPTLCSDEDGDGIYTYDLNKPNFEFEQYARYTVSFVTEPYHHTKELTMQIGNIGDTIYATGEYRPADPDPFIAWKNEIPLELKPTVSLKDAVSQYEAQTGETLDTNRYYFLMPNGENGMKGKINNGFTSYYLKYCDSWYNKYTDTAGIYWYSGGEFKAPKYYGYTMEKGDSDGVFYADVPKSIDTFVFTNALEGGYNYYDDTYHLARQSYRVATKLNIDADKASPDKDYSFDNMICVLNPCENSEAEMTYPVEYAGEWYYYYGNGCYGKAKHGTEKDCLRDDHNHEITLDYKDEFYEFCSTTEGETPLTYSDPLYYYYEEGSTTPAWFLAEGYNSYDSFDYTYGIFGDYYIQEYKVDSPSKLSLYVYIYDEQKFYTLEDAWEKGFVDKEMAFIEYLKPNYIANILGDANKDHNLSVLDATYIQMAQAGLRSLYDEFKGEQCCGESTKHMTDFDHDGERSILDATAIQMKLAKID